MVNYINNSYNKYISNVTKDFCLKKKMLFFPFIQYWKYWNIKQQNHFQNL